jgi:L-fuculose-phosphate aldolase
MSEELRHRVIETAVEMNRCGLNRGTSGNLSVRLGAGMLITPSGIPYDRLTAGDLAHVDLVSGGSDGLQRPSSEWRIHRDVYLGRDDAEAILHAHPMHSTALACLGRDLPAFHYMVAAAGGNTIRCAPYATFGTQALSDHVTDALADRKACLMANHGLLCLAGDIEKALALAVEVEALAETYLQCLAVGDPVILGEDEMERVIEKFRDYGQR